MIISPTPSQILPLPSSGPTTSQGRQQLPVARPPNWNYRKSTTALSMSSTYKSKTSLFGIPLHGEYITAKVRGPLV